MSTIAFKKYKTRFEEKCEHIDYLFYIDVRDEKEKLTDYFIPNGRFEVIVDLGDRVQIRQNDGEWTRRPRISIVGHYTSSIQIACEGNHFSCIGAILSLGKISTLIPDPEMRKFGIAIDIDDLFPGTTEHVIGAMTHAESIHQKVDILDAFVCRKLRSGIGHPAFLDHSLKLILQHKGRITMCDLSKKVRCSTRHLRRSFLHHFGISPKVFSSVVRLHDTVGNISRSDLPMSDIISDNGYFDRAHFYKEFTRIVGVSPSHYFKSDRKISKHFLANAVAPPYAQLSYMQSSGVIPIA